ncbi:hypothetical protein Taro_016295, partial [Colocasia esculenta]|nr:hypothetical protein [Colocasia esculenta]
MATRQMEVHYINTGFPYTVTESFMDLFEGLTYAQADAALSGVLHDQGSSYWPIMHTHSYKYGVSNSGNNSSYSLSHVYEVNDHALRFDGGGRTWDSPALLNNEELPQLVLHGTGVGPESGAHSGTEECIRTQHNAASPQELLDLGEAVGTQSRGLPQELILSLPVTKYKCGFFSRKKGRGERCVICQMDYKRGDRRMTLPCKHVYHAGCVSKWLGINKDRVE